MSDLGYIENRWALDGAENKCNDRNDLMKQFAYKVLKEDFISRRSREDGKESEVKQLQSDIYQLMGFYSVFQGVWVQGVTQLDRDASCRASAIPILLSGLVSIATIIGVHLKLSKVCNLRKYYFKDKLDSQVRESRISAFENKGLNLDLETILLDTKQPFLTSSFEKDLEYLHRTRILLLLFLTIISVLFAWLVGAIMCDKFP